MQQVASNRRARFCDGPVVYLRALSIDDVPQWASWFNDRDVTSAMNKGMYPNTLQQQLEIFERLHRSRSDVQLGIALQSDDSLVGIIGLHHIDWVHRKGELSIVIGEPAAQGKGVATEAIALMVTHAFDKLNLHRLSAGMWAPNAASRHAFEKNGFVVEGTLREAFWHEGGYVDEVRLGLLRSEWDPRRKSGSR